MLKYNGIFVLLTISEMRFTGSKKIDFDKFPLKSTLRCDRKYFCFFHNVLWIIFKWNLIVFFILLRRLLNTQIHTLNWPFSKISDPKRWFFPVFWRERSAWTVTVTYPTYAKTFFKHTILPNLSSHGIFSNGMSTNSSVNRNLYAFYTILKLRCL